MKKIYLLLLATFIAAAMNAQTMQVWSNNQPVYQQSVDPVDSIIFLEASIANNLPTLDKICKTWLHEYNGPKGYSYMAITLTDSYTFTYDDDGDYSTGKYMVQGNLILFCITTMGDSYNFPSILIYNDNKLYGDLGGTYYEFH